MALDLSVVKFRGVAPISDIALVIKNPPTLRVRGARFVKVTDVLFNGLNADFAVKSETELFVTIPKGAIGARIESLEVLSDFFQGLDHSRMRFLFGRHPGVMRGVLKAVQSFVVLLFTTPGSDIFNPNRGGGLPALAGSYPHESDVYPILSRAMLAVSRATEQMISMQAGRDLPDDERLAAVDIVDSRLTPDSTGIRLHLRFTTFAGDEAVALLGT